MFYRLEKNKSKKPKRGVATQPPPPPLHVEELKFELNLSLW